MMAPNASFTLCKTLVQGFASHDITFQRRSDPDERDAYHQILRDLSPPPGALRLSGEVVLNGARFRCFGIRSGDDWALSLSPVVDSIPPLSTLGVTRGDLVSLAESDGLTLVCSDFGHGKTTTLFSLVAGMSTSVTGRTCYLIDRPEYSVADQYSVVRMSGRDVESIAAGIHDAIYAKYRTIVVDALADEAAATAAVYAASLGYRVLASVSADSAISGIRWLFANTPIDYHRRVPRALSGVWAQRLIAKDGKTYLAHESVKADTHFCRMLGSKRIEAEDVVEAAVRQGRQRFWDMANKHIREGAFDRTDALAVLSEAEGVSITGK